MGRRGDSRSAAGVPGAKVGSCCQRGIVMPAEETIDWALCPLVEVNPSVLSGSPVLRGTRMPVNAIVDNFDYGVSVAEISEQERFARKIARAIVEARDKEN